MNFNPNIHSLKWEFGYWGETIENWHKSGLPEKKYPVLSKKITKPASFLYIPAWTCQGVDKLPNGIGVMSGGLYWPTKGFPLDTMSANNLIWNLHSAWLMLICIFHLYSRLQFWQKKIKHLSKLISMESKKSDFGFCIVLLILDRKSTIRNHTEFGQQTSDSKQISWYPSQLSIAL